MTITDQALLFVLVAVGIFLDAWLLCLACRVVLGRFPAYTRAALVTALSLAALGVCSVAVLTWLPKPIGLGGVAVGSFALAVLATRWLLRTREGGRMSYGKACMVQGVNLGFHVAIGLVVVLILAALFLVLTHVLGSGERWPGG